MYKPRIVRSSLIVAVVALHGALAPCVVKATDPEVITNSIQMKLVAIPAGEFWMGAEESRDDTLHKFPYCDPKWLDGEVPRHKVRITKPFYLGQYEVTLNQFLHFYHDAKYKIEAERDGKPSWGYEHNRLSESNRFRPWDPIGWKIEMDHPVIYVTWNDAVAFCEWLSKKEGQTYRLPTEAEWEYACRAGTNSRYSFGDDPEELVHFANATDADRKVIFANSTIATFDKDGKKAKLEIPYPFISRPDGYPWTAPVGKFRPNAFGLYDMHGNAWEWCSDWYDEHYYVNSSTEDPTGPGTGVARVCRGGGYIVPPVRLRCANRLEVAPSYRDFESGFRVVRVQ
jgi:formylglycine-generating enzyme required for sulfatase activity